jgi:hypothetical protein
MLKSYVQEQDAALKIILLAECQRVIYIVPTRNTIFGIASA